MSEKIKVKSVYLNRAEGPCASCGPCTFEGPDAMRDAQRQMYSWGITAPDPGNGYDKCDFIVTFEDDDTYQGRYDLQSTGLNDSGETIGQQMVNFVSFLAGLMRPAWMNDKEWARSREMHKAEESECLEWLEMYEVA